MNHPAIEKSGTGIKRHDHELACRLYAKPEKNPTPVNIADSAARIDGLVRRLLTREISFAELHESVKTELEFVFEAGNAASEVQNETE